MPCFTTAELRKKYDAAARWYDLGTAVFEWLLFARLRRELLARATGRVLEVACGTGRNFRHYAKGTHLLAVDLSPAMLAVAEGHSRKAKITVGFAVMDAGRLAFADGEFDTVVSSLATCTFPDPVMALREMARVCAPGGRILLLEHGRSHRPSLAGWQDRRAEWQSGHLGCHWNRDTRALVGEAGLHVQTARRHGWGMVHALEVSAENG